MNTSNTNMQVAQTILQQLGGNRFTVMTGSKNYVAGNNSLTMKLTRNKAGAKWLTITLNGSDLYDLCFKKINRAGDIIIVQERNDIYFDQLQEIFTEVTGLYTTL